MAFNPNDPNDLAAAEREIQILQDYQKQLTNQAQNLKDREKALSSMAAVRGGADLKSHFKSFLPEYLVPGNVGPLNAVTWPFYQQVSFDFGDNPTIASTSRQTSSFQVTQEAAFLLLALTRNSQAQGTSGASGPWQIEIRDRQSSRQLNDLPIPWQNIGSRSLPTVLPTPYLIMPNAFIDVIMSSWIPTGVNQVTAGSSKQQLTFFGYRVRIEDAGQVLSSIFS